jgi:hypothetical protein
MRFFYPSVFAFIIFTALDCCAQRPDQMPLYTPGGYRNGMHYHEWSNIRGGSASLSGKYLYTVELAIDSTFESWGIIDISTETHFLNVYVGGWERSITPAQTKSISRVLKDGSRLVGVPNDNSWLFIASCGKINTYSPLAEFKIDYATNIQKGDGAILPLTATNLLEIIDTPSPEVKSLIDKNKLIKAIIKYNKEN